MLKALVTFLGRGRQYEETGYRPSILTNFHDGSDTYDNSIYFRPAVG